ncbi:MAG: AHH domain-containing protein, partial [Planctomycetaceae bacterium]
MCRINLSGLTNKGWPRAYYALGIDLNGAENGVWLPSQDYPGRIASIHRGWH